MNVILKKKDLTCKINSEKIEESFEQSAKKQVLVRREEEAVKSLNYFI